MDKNDRNSISWYHSNDHDSIPSVAISYISFKLKEFLFFVFLIELYIIYYKNLFRFNNTCSVAYYFESYSFHLSHCNVKEVRSTYKNVSLENVIFFNVRVEKIDFNSFDFVILSVPKRKISFKIEDNFFFCHFLSFLLPLRNVINII